MCVKLLHTLTCVKMHLLISQHSRWVLEQDISSCLYTSLASSQTPRIACSAFKPTLYAFVEASSWPTTLLEVCALGTQESQTKPPSVEA